MKFQSFPKTRIDKAFLASCLLLTLSGLAQGATYYVSTSGSDSNAGTQSAPFRHVSHGVAAAHAGDTITVMNGTYDNEGQVADSSGGGSVVTMTNAGSSGNPITIMAQNRGGAVLNAASSTQSSLGCYGAWAYFDLSYTAYVVIQGFVIENACVNGFHANANAHDITIRWNEIKNIGNWNNPASTLSPSGIYLNSSEYNFTFDGNIFHDMTPEVVPKKPGAAKLRAERMKNGTRPNPSVFCLPMGIPVNNFLVEVVKFIQAPKEIVVIYEVDGSYRQIYTDGRPLPKDMSPSWLGYSTAHWDGDTLVVETEGFNDRTWLDMIGHSHSEALTLGRRSEM